VRFAFIDAEKANYPVKLMCELLDVTRQGYYAWKKRGPSARARSDRVLTAQVRAVFAENKGRYGSPRIARELRGRRVRISNKRVERLMREQGLRARTKRRFRNTTDSSHSFVASPNVIERNFTTTGPNQLWLADITYLPLRHGGFAYAAIVMDAFSRRVVGFHVDANLRVELCMTALRQALTLRRPADGLIHHSDRGIQYATHEYRKLLVDAGVNQSMSRKGDCWDNAPMESFFGRMKNELLDETKAFESIDDARAAVTEYVLGYYNPKRRHSGIGYVSPVDFEKQAAIP